MARTLRLCVAILVIVPCFLDIQVAQCASLRPYSNSDTTTESAAYGEVQDDSPKLCPCGNDHDEEDESTSTEKECNKEVIRLLQNQGKAISKVGRILRDKDGISSGNRATASATVNIGGHGGYAQPYPLVGGFHVGQSYPAFSPYSFPSTSPNHYANTQPSTRGSTNTASIPKSASQANEYFVQLADGKLVPLSSFTGGGPSQGKPTSSSASVSNGEINIVLPNGEKVPYSVYESIVSSFENEEPVDVTLLDGVTYEADTYEELVELTNGAPDSILNLPDGKLVTAGTYEDVINAYCHHPTFVQLPSGDIVSLIKFNKPSSKPSKTSTTNASKARKTSNSSRTPYSTRKEPSGKVPGSHTAKQTSAVNSKHPRVPSRQYPTSGQNVGSAMITEEDETNIEEDTALTADDKKSRKSTTTMTVSSARRTPSGTSGGSFSGKHSSRFNGQYPRVPSRNYPTSDKSVSDEEILEEYDETSLNEDTVLSSGRRKSSQKVKAKTVSSDRRAPAGTNGGSLSARQSSTFNGKSPRVPSRNFPTSDESDSDEEILEEYDETSLDEETVSSSGRRKSSQKVKAKTVSSDRRGPAGTNGGSLSAKQSSTFNGKSPRVQSRNYPTSDESASDEEILEDVETSVDEDTVLSSGRRKSSQEVTAKTASSDRRAPAGTNGGSFSATQSSTLNGKSSRVPSRNYPTSDENVSSEVITEEDEETAFEKDTLLRSGSKKTSQKVTAKTASSDGRTPAGTNSGSFSAKQSSTLNGKSSRVPSRNYPTSDDNISSEVITEEDDERGFEEGTEPISGSKKTSQTVTAKTSSSAKREPAGTNGDSFSAKQSSNINGKSPFVPSRDHPTSEVNEDSEETSYEENIGLSTSAGGEARNTVTTKTTQNRNIQVNPADDDVENKPSSSVDFKESTLSGSAASSTIINRSDYSELSTDDEDNKNLYPASNKALSKSTTKMGDTIDEEDTTTSSGEIKQTITSQTTRDSENSPKAKVPGTGSLMSSTRTSSSMSSTLQERDDDLQVSSPTDKSLKSKTSIETTSAGSSSSRTSAKIINEDANAAEVPETYSPDSDESSTSTYLSTSSQERVSSSESDRTHPMIGKERKYPSSLSQKEETYPDDSSLNQQSSQKTTSKTATDSDVSAPLTTAGKSPSGSESTTSKRKNTTTYKKTILPDGTVTYTPVNEPSAGNGRIGVSEETQSTAISSTSRFSASSQSLTDSDSPQGPVISESTSTTSTQETVYKKETNSDGHIQYVPVSETDSAISRTSSTVTTYRRVIDDDGHVNYVPVPSEESKETAYKKTVGRDGEILHVPASNRPTSSNRESYGSTSSYTANDDGRTPTDYKKVIGPTGEVQYVPVNGKSSESTHRTIVDSTGNTYKVPSDARSSQSYKTVTDKNGNTYFVDSNGQIHQLAPENTQIETPSLSPSGSAFSSSDTKLSYVTVTDKRGNTYHIPQSDSLSPPNNKPALAYFGEDGRIHYKIPTSDAEATSLTEDQIKEGLQLAATEYIIYKTIDGRTHHVPKSAAPLKKITSKDGTTYEIPVVPSPQKHGSESISYHKFTSPDGTVYDVPTGKTPGASGKKSSQKTTITMERITTPDGTVHEVPVETTIDACDGSITTKVTYNPSAKNQYKTILDKNGNVYMVHISGSSSFKTSPPASQMAKVKTVIDTRGNVQYLPLNTPSASSFSRTIIDVNENVFEIPSYISPVGNVKKQDLAAWISDSSISSSLSSSYDGSSVNSHGHQASNARQLVAPVPSRSFPSQDDTACRHSYPTSSVNSYGVQTQGASRNNLPSVCSPRTVYLEDPVTVPCASSCTCSQCA